MHAHIHIHTYTYTHTQAHRHRETQTYRQTCMHTYVYIYIDISVCAHTVGNSDATAATHAKLVVPVEGTLPHSPIVLCPAKTEFL